MSLPRATYRLQFRDGMDFDRAAGLAPYLRRLGVSHLYASPVFAARTGSAHGYDVTDHNVLEPALGGEPGFLRLSAALKRQGLGLILDIVPNHMAASAENAWWRSVLEWGERSPYAGHFDIDWGADRLLLPVLGRSCDEALARGELALVLDAEAGGIALSAPGHALPLRPASYAPILAAVPDGALAALAAHFVSATPESSAERHQALAALLREPGRRDALDSALRELSADRDRLDRLHGAQVWRLAHWQQARTDLTYRRFFEIADLVGVRVERPAVFDDVHRLVLRLVREGHADGVRVDHVDGLADPKAYLQRLRAAIGPDAWLVVEKILEGDEALRPDWPVDGSTGYEFIADIARLMCPAAQAPALTAHYQGFLGRPVEYDRVVRSAKREILSHNLAAELARLVRQAADLTRGSGVAEDTLRQAIVALICRFPCYRTYVDADGPDAVDAALIAGIADAAGAADEADAAAVEAVGRLLSLQVPDAARDRALAFVRRFQQTTGPVMAKAVEDTAFYRYHRLIGLNEVGGDPADADGAPLRCLRPLQAGDRATRSMAATATHDTKRGEDARARLYVLSEVPDLWAGAVGRWSAMNAGLRTALDGGEAPGRNTEWLVYQALYGAWPLDLADGGMADLADRMQAFAEKAVREAKQRTSWLAPDARYEEAVRRFVTGLLCPGNRRFLDDFRATCAPLWRAGAINGLAQVLLKAAAPRVPDLYQGTELWDFSLVDPDNRRPVDFIARAGRLEALGCGTADTLWSAWQGGTIKLHLLHAALQARAKAPRLYAEGSSEPVRLRGPLQAHAFALLRRLDDRIALLVVPRLTVPLLAVADRPRIDPGVWRETALELPASLAGRPLTDALSGRRRTLATNMPLAGLLDVHPFALLHGPEP